MSEPMTPEDLASEEEGAERTFLDEHVRHSLLRLIREVRRCWAELEARKTDLREAGELIVELREALRKAEEKARKNGE